MDPVDDLLEELVSYRFLPRDFVLWAFPWGERGTDLETVNSLEPWQDRALGHLQEGMQEYALGNFMPIRQCFKSGHGVGKSAYISWTNLWGMCTRENTRGVLTAGTEAQLKTKTWVEFAKWHRLFIGNLLFSLTATALFPKDKGPTKEWRLDIIPWSEHNPSAFAGLHNQGKRILATCDEASEIPTIIHETTAGAETDANTEIIRILTGNPTDPDSYFRECSEGGKFESMWFGLSIKSEDVSLTNKALIAQEREVYGEDSDYFRVRRLGLFPKQGGDSFITRLWVEQAQVREVPPDQALQALRMGVDIGRKNDPTVIRFRQGLDARTIPKKVFRPDENSRIPPTLQILQIIIEQIALYDPDTLFIDIGYIGAAVYDLLLSKQLSRPIIYPVDFGSGATPEAGAEESVRYLNKRAQIWGRLRDWLLRGCIDKDAGFLKEAISPRYKFRGDMVMQLESKEQIKTRLDGQSTDEVDSLACTFAEVFEIPVDQGKGLLRSARSHGVAMLAQDNLNYNPFEETRLYGRLH